MEKNGFLKSEQKTLTILHNTLEYGEYAPYNILYTAVWK